MKFGSIVKLCLIWSSTFAVEADQSYSNNGGKCVSISRTVLVPVYYYNKSIQKFKWKFSKQ